VLLIAWLAAGTLVDNETLKPRTGFDIPGNIIGNQSSVSIEAVLNNAPFGRPEMVVVKPISKAAKVVAPSKLNIKLHGTVVTDKGSVAMVAARAGAPLEVYRIGDRILPGVTLSQVESSRVVVKTASGFEEIWMEDIVGMPAQQLNKTPPQGIEERQEEMASLQSVSRGLLERELNDLGKLMTQIRVTPYFENGQTVGFKVSNIESGSIFERVGLRNDDVIQSVNGQSVADPQQAMQMYQQLRNANQLDVVLLRNQHVQIVRYQIQ